MRVQGGVQLSYLQGPYLGSVDGTLFGRFSKTTPVHTLSVWISQFGVLSGTSLKGVSLLGYEDVGSEKEENFQGSPVHSGLEGTSTKPFTRRDWTSSYLVLTRLSSSYSITNYCVQDVSQTHV